HLYLYHYVTNEALLTTLAAAVVYLALRALHAEPPTAGPHALLGLVLGLALLAKVTAVVTAGVVLLVLAGRLVVRRPPPAAWLRGVGVTFAPAGLVCGWHYGRVWAHFGTPLVNNFDAASGFHFWQEPGYATAADLVGFGRALVDPFFSAFHGLPDGL